MRVTTSDFTKNYIKCTILADPWPQCDSPNIREFYIQDNKAMILLLAASPNGEDEEVLAKLWRQQEYNIDRRCRLQWSTVGVFSPDPASPFEIFNVSLSN